MTPLDIQRLADRRAIDRDAQRASGGVLENFPWGIRPVLYEGSVMDTPVLAERRQLLDPVYGMMPVAGISAFHGSPHLFNKFRMDKIGTGEGAQAYGHGLYFAENPAVAKTHLGDLPHIQWKKIRDSINLDVDRGYVARRPDGTEKVFANESDAWGWVKDAMGNLYKVDIPDEHIGKMFDWDKPLRGQGEEVLKLADKYGVSHNADGGTLLESMSANLRNKALASDEIKELGFPGIKYLDQFSRGKYHVQLKYKGEPYGEPYELLAKNQVDDFVKEYEAKGFGTEVVEKGTSNFVLFDDQIPQILEVNDKPVRGILSGR